jgi:hypothetical protein
MLSLQMEGLVVASQDGVKDAGVLGCLLELEHPLLQQARCESELVGNHGKVARAARDIVSLVVRVEDGEPVRVLVNDCLDLVLRYYQRRARQMQ